MTIVVGEQVEKAGNAYRVAEEAERPWGKWVVLETGRRFTVKRLTLKPGANLSLQRHRWRDEHWTVVEGKAEVGIDGSTRILAENQSVFIPAGALHRLCNAGADELVVVEVQYGKMLDEADIERFDDSYGRAG